MTVGAGPRPTARGELGDPDVERVARSERRAPVGGLLRGCVDNARLGGLKAPQDDFALEDLDLVGLALFGERHAAPLPAVGLGRARLRRVQVRVRSPGRRARRQGCATATTEKGRSPVPRRREAGLRIGAVGQRPAGRADAPVPAGAEIGLGHRQLRQRRVEHHDPGTGRNQRLHGVFGAALPAQQPGEPIAAGRDQLGIPRLDDLPRAGRALERQRVGPGEEFELGDAGQRPGGEIDDHHVAEVKRAERPGMKVKGERSDPRRAGDAGDPAPSLLAGVGARPPGGPARGSPRPPAAAGARSGRRRAAAGRERRAPVPGTRPGGGAAPGARRAGRHVVDRRILAEQLQAARLGVGDPGHPQVVGAAVMLEPDDVGGVEREGARAAARRSRSRGRPRPPSAPGGSGGRPLRAAPPAGSSPR